MNKPLLNAPEVMTLWRYINQFIIIIVIIIYMDFAVYTINRQTMATYSCMATVRSP